MMGHRSGSQFLTPNSVLLAIHVVFLCDHARMTNEDTEARRDEGAEAVCNLSDSSVSKPNGNWISHKREFMELEVQQ